MDLALERCGDRGFARRVRRLPGECQMLIASYFDCQMEVASVGMQQEQQYHHTHVGDPTVPPRTGESPFLKLPVELRRKILVEFLPPKHTIFHPETDEPRRKKQQVLPPSRNNTLKQVEKPARNLPICEILVLNHQLCAEFSAAIYEERTFGVHVYEGVYSGGIKFLNSGLQRLQHKDKFQVYRFKRFDDDDAFGLARTKRLVITVHPCRDKRSATGRHDPIYTHFMMLALVKLLEVQFDKREITYLKIKLLEPEPALEPAVMTVPFLAHGGSITKPENYWWNPTKKAPRATSVHALSNVELILRPFYRLYRVHQADIELPASMDNDKSMQNFKTHLISAMTSKGGEMVWDDELDHKIEAARDSLDDWLFTMKFGNGGVPEKDVWIADEVDNEDFSDHDGDKPVPLFAHARRLNGETDSLKEGKEQFEVVTAEMSVADAELMQQLMDEDEDEGDRKMYEREFKW